MVFNFFWAISAIYVAPLQPRGAGGASVGTLCTMKFSRRVGGSSFFEEDLCSGSSFFLGRLVQLTCFATGSVSARPSVLDLCVSST